MTKPSSGCKNYDSYLSGTKDEIMRHSYRSTKTAEGGGCGGWMGQQNLNIGVKCLPPISFQQSTFVSFNHDHDHSLEGTEH